MSIKTVFNTIFASTQSEEVKIPAWVCVIDAKKRDAENLELYTPKERAVAMSLRDAVESVYGRSRVFMNYRKGFIAVKVNKPLLADKASIAAIKLDCWCETNKVEKVITRHGNYVYRVPTDILHAMAMVK